MGLSTRAAVVRNLATAIVNGIITIVLLLIAPLGLAAVIGNTFLVTVASFFVGTFADMVVDWLALSDLRKQHWFKTQLNRQQINQQMSTAIKKNVR